MRRKRRRRRRVAQIILILFSFVALIVAGSLAYLEMQPMVANAVTIEAGTSSIEVSQFLLENDREGKFITDIASLNLNSPGIYEILIKVNRRTHTSSLEVIDTKAPNAEPVEIIALMNEKLKASDFVDNVIDATDVEVSFVSEPDVSTPGEKEVKIALEDLGKNIKIIESKLTILDVKSSIQVEAGSILDVKAEDFVDNDNIKVNILSDLSALDISKPTVHSIQIEVDGKNLSSNIEVIDTTPPLASSVDKETWKGETLLAGDFVRNISDVSAYSVAFGRKPDFELIGSQEVTVIIKDLYNNSTELKSMLTVKEDTEPPVLYGIQDINVFEGDTVSYKKGISVKDNKDTNVNYQIDTSQVNISKVGTYRVYYTAKDSAGNKATEVANVTVQKFVVTEEMLYAKVDPVLDSIVKEGMTKREIAYEIFLWVNSHIGYTGSSDKSSWIKEAYRGIVNGLGDCFTYYAVAEAFLTRAEIDNMRVTRVGGRTQHFWNLVNCGDGWYHFDTCPHKDKIISFMLTDAETEAYTKKRGNNYYTYDKSLYPAVNEE